MTAPTHAAADTPASGARLGSIEPAPPFRDRAAFADQVASLKSGAGARGVNERLLMFVGGALAPIGIVVVLLGWRGASQTPNLFEQVPYLISGGLLGLGLTFLGGFLYFAHWLTELVKESRAQSAAVVDALDRLRQDMASRDARQPTAAITDALAEPVPVAPAAPAVAAAAPVATPHRRAEPLAATSTVAPAVEPRPTFVSTPRGSMAHDPTCAVVAGKDGLRLVTQADGLKPCKLCEPY